MELRPGRAGALVDSPDEVVLSGATPGGRVTIEAHLELGGQTWACTGEYVVDDNGQVDTSQAPSQSGSYLGVDPFGLFWSAEVLDGYDWSVMRPMRVTLRAACEELTVETSYTRAVLVEGAFEHAILAAGVAGRFFVPADGPDQRAVVLISVSEGGPGAPFVGALLAGHALPALSLAQWKHPGVPDVLRDIDVGVVARACDWLRAQSGVADVPPAVVGYSRGGELALLAAALTPDQVGPVVSIAGSGVPWGAWGQGTDVLETAYRFRGQPVPQMAEDEEYPDACIDDAEMVAAAEVPVERARGPVLLLSGDHDQLWPSARLTRIAEDRAHREGAADKVTHVAHPEGGHVVGSPPGIPARTGLDLGDLVIRFGGSRSGNQAARRDGWRVR